MLRDIEAVWVAQDVAHLGGRWGGLIWVHQASVLDDRAVDTFTLKQHGVTPAGVDVGRIEKALAVVAVLVVVVLGERAGLRFDLAAPPSAPWLFSRPRCRVVERLGRLRDAVVR